MNKDIGLLILRVCVGGFMLIGHGWGKLADFSEKASQFPDPLGVTSPVSLALVVFAEFFCAAAVILGFKIRYTAIPLVFAMGVAAFVQHANDPWANKERALLFLIPFLTLIFTGGGRFSLDMVLKGKS